MGNAAVQRRLVYKRDNATELLMDVYTPANQTRSSALPAIVFVHGGPISPEMMAPREWGVFTSYGQLAAASGLAGVVFNHRLYAPTDYETAQADIAAAIDYVRGHAREVGVDGERLSVWAFSGGGPLLSWCLRERPPYLRCLVAFYAVLDARHLVPGDADPGRIARAHRLSPAAYIKEKAAGLPMFIARAGLDAAIVNDSIDLFVREALAANASLDFANHSNGHHGFDMLDDDERSREIIARAAAFVKTHLSAP
jgi:acetyl esterase/lipase